MATQTPTDRTTPLRLGSLFSGYGDLILRSRKPSTHARSGSPKSTNPSPASSPTTGQMPRTSATSLRSTGVPFHR